MVFVPFTGIDNHKNCVTLGAALLDGESIPAYKWVLEAFLKTFGKQPKLVVTDQCPAIKQAVSEVFTESRHRFCMWHISTKLPMKVYFFKFCISFIFSLNIKVDVIIVNILDIQTE